MSQYLVDRVLAHPVDEVLRHSGSQVDLVIRGVDLAAGMSQYLVDRVLAHPSITVHTATQVTALHGDAALRRPDVHHARR